MGKRKQVPQQQPVIEQIAADTYDQARLAARWCGIPDGQWVWVPKEPQEVEKQ